ncbi:MAG: YlxR family protein [Cellulomonas sp.]
MTRRARLVAAGSETRLSSPSRRAPDDLAVVVVGPVRTCVGCRSTDRRSVLLRIVVSADSAGIPVLVVDAGRCMPGRGAWLHLEPRCLELAERRRAFPRALRHAGLLDARAVEAYLRAP